MCCKLQSWTGAVLAYLFTWMLLMPGGAIACDFDACLSLYNNLKQYLMEPDPDMGTLCGLQQDMVDCKKKTSKRCRGDLNYHFFEKLVRDISAKDALLNCQKYQHQISTQPTRHSPSSNPINNRANKSRSFTPLGEKCASKFNGDAQVSCALFGLTNLKTFSRSWNETGTSSCSLSGAWSMIDTPEFAIQITNKGGFRPLPKEITTTTLVTVIIKSSQCSERKTYQATFDEVPGMFSDGSSTAGSVYLETVKESEHVKIHIPYQSVVIDIMKQVYGNLPIPSLNIAVQLPQAKGNELASEPTRIRGLPLCFYGCPKTASIRTRSAGNPEKSVSSFCNNLNNGSMPDGQNASPVNTAMCESYSLTKSLLQNNVVVNHKLVFPGEDSFVASNEPSKELRAENSALISHSVRLFYGYKSLLVYFSILISVICS